MIESTLHWTQWDAFEREYAKCERTPEGHRLWKGRIDKDGYGVFRFKDAVSRNQRDIGAHRLAYMKWGHDPAIDQMRENFGVYLPDGLHLTSLGDCPRHCCEPSHITVRSEAVMQRFLKMAHADKR